MPETLLRTKLYIPPLRPNLVPRPRLIHQLNHGLEQGHKLTLVSAPAGFGKSTLLSDWVQVADQRPRVAWLSLDEADNDLARFLTYFVASLQTIESEVGLGLVAALQAPGPVNVEAVLTTLLNEIAEFPDEVILILDDYHVIESMPVDQALTFLLDHLPPQMHLVIAGRIDPSLPLPRLRARGRMTEIRVDDLRFTPGEATAFLQQVLGLALSTQDIKALEIRTEGWIAGLQLAAISMRGLKQNSEITNFINSFTGSNRYIQDYLADEVLQQQSKVTKDFLLQTSILKRLCGPLCDAVRFGSSKHNSQAILEGLDSANLFIMPLDDERRWYRYHHLFADLLTYRLNRSFAKQIPVLHRRASLWYENEGHLDDAIRHAQTAADANRLADILEEHWQDIIHRGEANWLRQLLDSLGPECTRKSPPLSMAYCWIHVLTSDIEAISGHIKDIEAVLAKTKETEAVQQPMKLAVIPSLIETMKATISLENKKAQKAKEHAQRAITLIPDTSNPAIRMLLHGAAGFRLALAHRALGEYAQAIAVLQEGLEMLRSSENYFGAAMTVVQIVAIYREMGKREEVTRLCEDTLDYIKEHHWQKMPSSGFVYLLLAGQQADAGDIAEAGKNLEIGRGLVEKIESPYTVSLVNGVEEKLDHITLPPQPLIEPLSPRELEVLQLIAQGLSNREISERLFLALDTVKGHNRNIYGKLGVRRRTEAIVRARELGLL